MIIEAKKNAKGVDTMKPFDFEARFRNSPNVLLVLGDSKILEKDPELADKFFGEKVFVTKEESSSTSVAGKTVFLCSDLSMDLGAVDLSLAERVFVVRELSFGYDQSTVEWPVVGAGLVPLMYHGVALYYREFFPADSKIFQRVSSAHAFHSLTESSKPGIAYRTGTYLTKVRKDREGNLHYKLLRCSTNFRSGPTDDFAPVDTYVVGALNQEAEFVFENHARVNHGLAQIYHNQKGSNTQKQVKARIKMHADKTKDMPNNGIMAFTTDYDNLDRLGTATGPFRFDHKGVSKLTELKFKLKPMVAERPGCMFEGQFSIPLSPGSVVFIPLSTNRWYTHEIKPSSLGASMVPTRLGYVLRCSKTEAVYDRDGKTYIKEGDNRRKLEPPTEEDMQELKRLYAEENFSDALIDYSNKYFSMNQGDYERPGIRAEEDDEKETDVDF